MALNIEKIKEWADNERARQERAANPQKPQGGGKFSRDFEWFKLGKGTSVIRILPPDYNGESFIPDDQMGMPLFNHPIPDDKNFRTVRCLRRTYPSAGLTCPVCEALWELSDHIKKTGDTELAKVYENLNKMRKQVYCNVIDRNSTETEEIEFEGNKVRIPKVKIGSVPLSVYDYLRKAVSVNKKDITDPEKGRDIVIDKTGEGLSTRYSPQLGLEDSPMVDDLRLTNAVLSRMYNIGNIFKAPTAEKYDQIVAVADTIRSYISGEKAVNTKQERQFTEPTVDPAQFEGNDNTSLLGDDVPECFGNHIESYRKCLVCVVEEPCKGPSARKPEDERRAVHGI